MASSGLYDDIMGIGEGVATGTTQGSGLYDDIMAPPAVSGGKAPKFGKNPYAEKIGHYAAAHGLPLELFDAVIRNESGYNPRAVSKAGAQGLGQLMPETARGLGVTDSFDPDQNLNGAAKYLSNLYRQFGGDIDKTLAAYNAGPGAVKKYGGVPPYAETRAYVSKIRSQLPTTLAPANAPPKGGHITKIKPISPTAKTRDLFTKPAPAQQFDILGMLPANDPNSLTYLPPRGVTGVDGFVGSVMDQQTPGLLKQQPAKIKSAADLFRKPQPKDDFTYTGSFGVKLDPGQYKSLQPDEFQARVDAYLHPEYEQYRAKKTEAPPDDYNPELGDMNFWLNLKKDPDARKGTGRYAEVAHDELGMPYHPAYYGAADAKTWDEARTQIAQGMQHNAQMLQTGIPLLATEATEYIGRGIRELGGDSDYWKDDWWARNPDKAESVKDQQGLVGLAQLAIPGVGQLQGFAFAEGFAGRAIEVGPAKAGEELAKGFVESINFLEPGLSPERRGLRTANAVVAVVAALHAKGKFIDEPLITRALQKGYGLTKEEALAAMSQAKETVLRNNFKDGKVKGLFKTVFGSANTKPLKAAALDAGADAYAARYGEVFKDYPHQDVADIFAAAPKNINSPEYVSWAQQKMSDLLWKWKYGETHPGARKGDIMERGGGLTDAEKAFVNYHDDHGLNTLLMTDAQSKGNMGIFTAKEGGASQPRQEGPLPALEHTNFGTKSTPDASGPQPINLRVAMALGRFESQKGSSPETDAINAWKVAERAKNFEPDFSPHADALLASVLARHGLQIDADSRFQPGKPYDTNLVAQVVDHKESAGPLTVDEVLSPAIYKDGKLVKPAEITTKGAAKSAEAPVVAGTPVAAPEASAQAPSVTPKQKTDAFFTEHKAKEPGPPPKDIFTKATEERGGQEASPSPLKMTAKDITDNHLKDLSAYSDTLFRETNFFGWNDMTNPYGYAKQSEFFFSNSPDLATGQGKNKGIFLEVDAKGVQGQISRSKPTWELSWDQGHAEFVAKHTSGTVLNSAVRSVTIRPDLEVTAIEAGHLKKQLAGMVKQGWTVETLPDGSKRYVRPEAPAEVAKKNPYADPIADVIPNEDPFGYGGEPIRLTGYELGEHEDIGDLRQSAEVYMTQKLVGTRIINAATGDEIHFSTGSVKHTTQSGADRNKLKIVAALPELLERARYMGERPDYKARPGLAIHKYEGLVNLEGQDYSVLMVVRQMAGQNKFYYDHNQTQVKPVGTSGGSPEGETIQPTTSFEENVPQVEGKPQMEGGTGEVLVNSGVNPAQVIKDAGNLNFETSAGGSFTAERPKKAGRDFTWRDNFVAPLGIYDASGNIIQFGTYDRVGKVIRPDGTIENPGTEAAQRIRETEREITAGTLEGQRALDEIEHLINEAIKEKKTNFFSKTNKDKGFEDFVELVEKDFSDPERQAIANSNTSLGKALNLHDRLTENVRKYIIQARNELGIETPDDWGITEKGYYRHLFMGDIRVFSDGEFQGTARTYTEAQKMAQDILKKDPTAEVTARARDTFNGDPTLRVSTKKYFKVVNEIAGEVELDAETIMDDLQGIVGRKAAKQKMFGALLHRTGAKGYSKAYMDVMRIHVAQAYRTQALSKMQRAVQPVVEDLRANGKPGLADAIEAHVADLWGTPTKFEKDFGRLMQELPIIKDRVGIPSLAFRHLARQITGLQSTLKLRFSPRSALVNLLQPWATLWPYMTTADFGALYADLAKPSTRKELADKGVFQGTSKIVEGGISVIQGSSALNPLNWFSKASEMNRGMGYLFGYKQAKAKGATDEQAHANGLSWAEKVEFDNSDWNVQPLLRSSQGRVFGQFKSFLGKNLEAINDLMRSRPGDTPGSRVKRTSKWVTAQLFFGGVKSLGWAWKVIVGYLIVDQISKQLQRLGMDEEHSVTTAKAVYFGAPSLIGQDLSSSVNILDEPYGRSGLEKAANVLLGPTVGTVAGIIDAKGDPMKTARAITPAAKAAETFWQATQKGLDGTNAKVGNESVDLNSYEAVMRILGFTPVKQSEFFERKEAGIKEIDPLKPLGNKGLAKLLSGD